MSEPPQDLPSQSGANSRSGARAGIRRPQPVSNEELARVVARYPTVGRIEKRGGDKTGRRSAGLLFETETGGRYFLKKRIQSVHPKESVLWRHRVISHLVAKGFSTPAITENEAGETLTEDGEVQYELFEAAHGQDIYHDYESWTPFSRRDHARSAGEALARFHNELRDFSLADATPPGTSPATPETARFDLGFAPDLPAAVERRISASPALSEFFSNIRWKEEISGLYLNFHGEARRYMAGVQPWVTHGQWQANNLFFEHDRVASVVGFDLVDVAFRMYDLAAAVDKNAVLWTEIAAGQPNAVRFDVIEELLRGYCSLLPVSMVEAELLGAVLPIHHLDWALSGVEYALVHEASRERAQWYYNVYLRDHVRHYHTPSGQKILSFLRHAAAAG
ncbi:MAG: phosphotransferase enzyme family protein [Spirochaetota bacterium]